MADVSGFSRMMGADEEGTTARMREFHRRVQGLIEDHHGRLVDTAGDSAFGEFDSVVNAMRCAQRLQEGQAEANAGEPTERRIDTRIGVHLGDVIIEGDHVWGDGVNIAARLEQQAEPGGICVSEAVYQQVHNKIELDMQDVGMRELKNIEQPLRLYQVAPLGALVPTQIDSSALDQNDPVPAPRRGRRRGRRHGRRRKTEARAASWSEALLETFTLAMLVTGTGLILTPFYLFETAGVFPAAGCALVGTALGRAWKRVTGRTGYRLIPLGIGVAAGAAFTDWSTVTNFLFVLGGAILVSVGVSRNQLDRNYPKSGEDE